MSDIEIIINPEIKTEMLKEYEVGLKELKDLLITKGEEIDRLHKTIEKFEIIIQFLEQEIK